MRSSDEIACRAPVEARQFQSLRSNGGNGVPCRQCRSRRLWFALKKILASCRIASVSFDNIAVTAKDQPRRIDMRFISVFTHESTNRLPTEAEMASMHKL